MELGQEWGLDTVAPAGRQLLDNLIADGKAVPKASHTWHIEGNAHDPKHWKNTLYHFL